MSANISQKGHDHYVALKGVSLVANNTNPTVPSSTTPVTNTGSKRVKVYISGGTVSDIAINGVSQNKTKGEFTLQPGWTIAVTYTAAPNWHWFS